MIFNSFPNAKNTDLPSLKAFADDKLNTTQNLKFVLGMLENIVGKEEKAFHLFFTMFLKVSS